MKYGIYKGTLSIGFSGGEWKDEWDVREDYTLEQWEKLGEEQQDKQVREWMHDALGQYIEMSYKEPK
jgi:NRPS condensation-like uncharacterized protein